MSKKVAIIIGSTALAASLFIVSSQVSLPLQVKVTWVRVVPSEGCYTNDDGTYGNWEDVYTALIETQDLLGEWKLVCLTRGTNYSEDRTNQMFYMNFNTNIVTGERSDYGSSSK